MKKTFYILLFIFISTLVLNFTPVLGATTDKYTALSPIPGLTSSDVTLSTSGSTSGSGLTTYVKNLYKWGVALTSGLAVIVIMWGGIGYMTSAGGSGVEEAKGRISAALMGLLLALGSYIILKTINADLLETKFDLETLTVTSTSGTTNSSGYVATGGTTAAGTTSTGTTSGTVTNTTSGSISTLMAAGTTFPNDSWDAYALEQINKSGLLNLSPSDAAEYFPNGVTAEGYLNLIASVTSKESSFDPNNVYYEDTMGKNSVGLLQLSADDTVVKNLGYTEEDLKDPYKNLEAGIQIFANQVQKDGVISGQNSTGKWVGATAYWSTLR